MSKIFETQFENGSLIDRISKTSLTPVGTQTFKQTEKGRSVLFDGGVSASSACLQSNLKIVSVPYTLVVNFKYLKNASTSYLVSQTLTNNLGRLIIDLQATNRLEYFIGGNSVLTNPLQNNFWYQAIMIRDSDGVVTCYLNNTYIGTFTNANLPPTTNFLEIGGSTIVTSRTHFGHIQKVIVYNNNISEQERNQLYQEFLQSQITEKPVRGFELVKPTDLSYLKDSTVGTNLTDNYDFMSWTSTGTAFVSKTANSFTTNNAGGGVSLSSLLTIGKKYRMTIRGTTTSGFSVTNLSVSPTYATYGVGDFSSTIDFTASTAASLYLRNTASGTTTITHLSIQELTGLVAAYNFKRNGNTLVDISGNGYNGVITDVISVKDGMKFSGNAESSISTSLSLESSYFTYLGIIRLDQTKDTDNSSIIGANTTAPTIRFDAGTAKLTAYLPTIINFGTIPLKTDVQIALVKNGTTIKSYVDGKLLETLTDVSVSSISNIIFGQQGLFPDRAYNGIIKDFRIYNRALTEEEIKDYHNSFIKPVLLIDFSNEAVGNTI